MNSSKDSNEKFDRVSEGFDLSVNKEELLYSNGDNKENSIESKQNNDDKNGEAPDLNIYYEDIKKKQMCDIFQQIQQEEKENPQNQKNSWFNEPSINRFNMKSKSEDNYMSDKKPGIDFNIKNDTIQKQNDQIISDNKKNNFEVLAKLDEFLELNLFFYKKCLNEKDHQLSDDESIQIIVNNIQQQTKIFRDILDRIKLNQKDQKVHQNGNYNKKIEDLENYLSVPSNDFFFIQFDNLTKEFQNNESKTKNYVQDQKEVKNKINLIYQELEFDQQKQSQEQKNFQKFKERILQKNLFVFHNDRVMLLEIYKLLDHTKNQINKLIEKDELNRFDITIQALTNQVEELMLKKFSNELSSKFDLNIVDSFLYRRELRHLEETNEDLNKQNEDLQQQLQNLLKQIEEKEKDAKNNLNNIEGNFAKLQQEYLQQQDEKQFQEDKINGLQKYIQSFEDRINQLKAEFEIMTQNNDILSKYNTQISQEHQMISQGQDEIQRLKDINQRLMLKSHQNQNHYDNEMKHSANIQRDLEDRLKQIEGKNQYLEEQLKSQKHNDSFSALMKESDEFALLKEKNQNTKSQQEKTQLENLNKNLILENKKLNKALQLLNNKYNQCRTKLNLAEQEIEKIKQENKQNQNFRQPHDQTAVYQRLKNDYKIVLQSKNDWQKYFIVLIFIFALYFGTSVSKLAKNRCQIITLQLLNCL